MTTPIEQLRTCIDAWEWSFVEDRLNKRDSLIEEIFLLAETHKNSDVYAELEPWLKAFQISLEEQAKYEAWQNKLNDVYNVPEKKAELNAERAALLQPYIESGQTDFAPDWLSPYFNPRHGPAMEVRVNDEQAVIKKTVFLIPLADKMFHS